MPGSGSVLSSVSSSAETHRYPSTQQWHQVPEEWHTVQTLHGHIRPHTHTPAHTHTCVATKRIVPRRFLTGSWQLRTNSSYKDLNSDVNAVHWNVEKKRDTHPKSITPDNQVMDDVTGESEQDAKITYTDTHPWQSSHWVKCQQTIQSEKEMRPPSLIPLRYGEQCENYQDVEVRLWQQGLCASPRAVAGYNRCLNWQIKQDEWDWRGTSGTRAP